MTDIFHDAYASVVIERERLKTQLAALAAENERLRKAGDDLAENLNDCPACIRNCQSEIAEWNAAKEGRDAK